VLRIELKVVGFAVSVFTKLDGGAAQPEYTPAAVAGFSNIVSKTKRKIRKYEATFTAPSKRVLSHPKILQIQCYVPSTDKAFIEL
jgi:hypothetical protein